MASHKMQRISTISRLNKIVDLYLKSPLFVKWPATGIDPIMQCTNGRGTEEFLHFNAVIKICFEKKAFVFQLSCLKKAALKKAFALKWLCKQKEKTHLSITMPDWAEIWTV